jgi:hypothetical protein
MPVSSATRSARCITSARSIAPTEDLARVPTLERPRTRQPHHGGLIRWTPHRPVPHLMLNPPLDASSYL